MPEKQNIEYKSIRTDEYLRWICGFGFSLRGRNVHRATLHPVRDGSLGRNISHASISAFRRNATLSTQVASLRDAGLGRVMAFSTERFIPNGMKKVLPLRDNSASKSGRVLIMRQSEVTFNYEKTEHKR